MYIRLTEQNIFKLLVQLEHSNRYNKQNKRSMIDPESPELHIEDLEKSVFNQQLNYQPFRRMKKALQSSDSKLNHVKSMPTIKSKTAPKNQSSILVGRKKVQMSKEIRYPAVRRQFKASEDIKAVPKKGKAALLAKSSNDQNRFKLTWKNNNQLNQQPLITPSNSQRKSDEAPQPKASQTPQQYPVPQTQNIENDFEDELQRNFEQNFNVGKKEQKQNTPFQSKKEIQQAEQPSFQNKQQEPLHSEEEGKMEIEIQKQHHQNDSPENMELEPLENNREIQEEQISNKEDTERSREEIQQILDNFEKQEPEPNSLSAQQREQTESDIQAEAQSIVRLSQLKEESQQMAPKQTADSQSVKKNGAMFLKSRLNKTAQTPQLKSKSNLTSFKKIQAGKSPNSGGTATTINSKSSKYLSRFKKSTEV